MFGSIVVGTDGSQHRPGGGAPGHRAGVARWAPRCYLVSAYEPVPEGRLRDERQEVPEDLQWMVNPREDVESHPRRGRRTRSRSSGVEVETFAREGDPADAILDVAEEKKRRPDRGRQQGHDRRQALPARLGAQQGLPSRALQRDDHPHHLGQASAPHRTVRRGCSSAARPPRRAGRCRSGCRSRVRRCRERWPRAWRSTSAGLGLAAQALGGHHQRGGAGHVGRRHRRALVAARAGRTGARCAREGLLEDERPARRRAGRPAAS